MILLAFLTNITSRNLSPSCCITFMAKGTILITDETTIGQFLGTHLTPETLRMPTGGHRLNHSTDDKFTAFIATGCKKDMEITFTVFTTLEFIEDTILEWTEALGTSV